MLYLLQTTIRDHSRYLWLIERLKELRKWYINIRMIFQRPEDPIQFLAKYLAELPTEPTSGSDQDNGEKTDKDAA